MLGESLASSKGNWARIKGAGREGDAGLEKQGKRGIGNTEAEKAEQAA